MAKTCLECKTENPDSADFCQNCGNELKDSVTVQIQTSNVNTKYCTNCGSQIDEKAEICPKCGVRQPMSARYEEPIHQKKNPALAAVLSLLIVGLGQVYNGEVGKGILLFIVALIAGATIFIGIGIILVPIVYIFAIYDAYATATKINRSQVK